MMTKTVPKKVVLTYALKIRREKPSKPGIMLLRSILSAMKTVVSTEDGSPMEAETSLMQSSVDVDRASSDSK